MLEFIRKRDGRLVPFEEGNIASAIEKAVRAVGGSDMTRAAGIARQVVGILDVLYKDGRVPTVENVWKAATFGNTIRAGKNRFQTESFRRMLMSTPSLT